MSDCCIESSCNKAPKKFRCPVNLQNYSEVSIETILHQLKNPWAWQPTATRYFFCSDPECDVVYFGDDNSVILTAQLRQNVGIKDTSPQRLLCYCFNITEADYQQNNNVKDFVIEQTKNKVCSCTTSNPSGKCCLKDFPKTKS